jgi:hypothetical protein
VGLLNLVAFFKWEHVDVINFLLTLCKGFIFKQGTLDFFGLSGHLRCFIQFKNKLSPIQRGFAPGFVYYKKGCTRLAAASDKGYQLLAHGRWFFPGTPASSTTKAGHHDIAEILMKGIKFSRRSPTLVFLNVV